MNETTKSMRSALGRARGLGSAKSGTHHWIMQRVTAIIMIPLMLYIIYGFMMHVVFGNYVSAVNWLHNPLAATGIVVMLLAALYHAVLGLQVIIEDYVHSAATKFFSIISIKLIAALMAVSGLLATIKIMLGV